MKKYLLIIMFAACTAFVNAQDVSTAKWVPQPVVVDGNANDWHLPLNFYDSETKLLFAISNDSANIYLCFEAKDEATQRKIMRAGMKISLETKGRDRRSASVAFPLAPKDRDKSNEPDNTENTGHANASDNAGNNTQAADATYHKPDPTVLRQKFLMNNIIMNLEGFVTTNGMVPVRGKSISAAMNWDEQDNLFYEIAIPIKEFLEDGYTAEDIAREITLHVEVNAMQQTERRGGSGDGSGFSDQGGMSGMQGGGMRGGGMRGGGGGMRGGGMRGGGGMGASGSERTSFKQKFVLGTSTQQ